MKGQVLGPKRWVRSWAQWSRPAHQWPAANPVREPPSRLPQPENESVGGRWRRSVALCPGAQGPCLLGGGLLGARPACDPAQPVHDGGEVGPGRGVLRPALLHQRDPARPCDGMEGGSSKGQGALDGGRRQGRRIPLDLGTGALYSCEPELLGMPSAAVAVVKKPSSLQQSAQRSWVRTRLDHAAQLAVQSWHGRPDDVPGVHQAEQVGRQVVLEGRGHGQRLPHHDAKRIDVHLE